MDADYQQVLGERLRAVRGQQGLTLTDVEDKSHGEWKAVVVGSYERGDRAVSAVKLAALARFYGVPVRELLPPAPGEPPTVAAPDGAPRLVLDLVALRHNGAPELGPLTRFAQAVQQRRGDYNGQVITLRADDLDTLAIALGVERDRLCEQLERRGIVRSG